VIADAQQIVPSIFLRVEGEVRGKDRPRFDPRTRRPYTTQRTESAETNIRSVWREQGGKRLPDGPARIVVTLGVVRPKGHFKRNGELSAEGRRHVMPSRKKPDVDNALKLAMDALNGLAYADDVQIVDARVVRQWSALPVTVIALDTLVQEAAGVAA